MQNNNPHLCPACGSNELMYIQEQTGQKDWPARAYLVCRSCGFRMRSIPDLENERANAAKGQKNCTVITLVGGLIGLLIILIGIIGEYGALMILGFSAMLFPVITLIYIFVYKARFAKMTAELEALKHDLR